MNMWKVTMRVDGEIITKVIQAQSMRDAQDIFRKIYAGHQTVLIKTEPCR